jgi:AAA domain-containing protein
MAKVFAKTPSRKKTAPEKKKKAFDDLEEFKLPTKKSTPMENIGDYSSLLFGSKKIGKTRLASMFPNAYFMGFEEGTKAISVFKNRMTSWPIAKKAVRLLKKDTTFETIVVDTADESYAMCFDYTCQEKGWDHPSDEGFGKGWSEIKRRYSRWVNDLLATGKGVIFISHATEREIKRRDGSTYDQIQTTMAGQARDILEGLVDIWAYFHYEDGRRVLQIRGNDEVAAGHRLNKHFRTPDGKDLDIIDMGDSEEEGYKNLIDAFNNTYVPPVKKKTEASTVVRKKAKKVR